MTRKQTSRTIRSAVERWAMPFELVAAIVTVFMGAYWWRDELPWVRAIVSHQDDALLSTDHLLVFLVLLSVLQATTWIALAPTSPSRPRLSEALLMAVWVAGVWIRDWNPVWFDMYDMPLVLMALIQMGIWSCRMLIAGYVLLGWQLPILVLTMAGVGVSVMRLGEGLPQSPGFILAVLFLVLSTFAGFRIVHRTRARIGNHRRSAQVSSRTTTLLWSSPPLLFGIGLFLHAMDVPLSLRVWASDTQLLVCADAAPLYRGRHMDYPYLKPLPTPIRVGLFSVQSAYRIRNEVWFNTTTANHGGLVFSPGGPPAVQARGRRVHLYGPWYAWKYDLID